MKDYWKYEKVISRGELIKLCWMCSVPIVGWLTLIFIWLIKPHNKNGRFHLPAKKNKT